MSASIDRGGLSKSCRTFGYIGCCTCLRGRLFCCYQAEQRAIPWSSKNKKYRKRLELYQAGKPSLRQVKSSVSTVGSPQSHGLSMLAAKNKLTHPNAFLSERSTSDSTTTGPPLSGGPGYCQWNAYDVFTRGGTYLSFLRRTFFPLFLHNRSRLISQLRQQLVLHALGHQVSEFGLVAAPMTANFSGCFGYRFFNLINRHFFAPRLPRGSVVITLRAIDRVGSWKNIFLLILEKNRIVKFFFY